MTPLAKAGGPHSRESLQTLLAALLRTADVTILAATGF